MVSESADIRPRHLTLLFASLSLCVFFIAETFQFIAAIRTENVLEAQSHRLGPRSVEVMTERRDTAQSEENENEISAESGESSYGDFIAQDKEQNYNEVMTTGLEKSSIPSTAGELLARGGETDVVIAQDGEKHSTEVVIDGVEASNDELMAQDGAESSGEWMATGIIESSVQSMAQDVINDYPYNLLRDVGDYPVNLKEDGDIPLFWHIHKSGGSSMKHIFTCLRKVQTRRMNDPNICTDQEPILKICHLPFGTENLGSRVINADISSINGIERALDLGLTTTGTFRSSVECTSDHDDGCVDEEFIVDTSRIYDALKVFTPSRRARLFMLLRHPVERAISKYFYIKVATWERNYKPQVQNMTLLEYADSKLCYNNWVTRRLVNKMEGVLTVDDLKIAKEILRRKTLVLLLEDMDGAVERLRSFFGWNTEPLDQEQQNCLKDFTHDNPINVNNNKGNVLAGGPEWKAIKEKNLMDIELFFYAKELYQLQEQVV